MPSLLSLGCSPTTQPMPRPSILSQVKPPTGEPDAGDPQVRFGGRGDRDNWPSLPLFRTKSCRSVTESRSMIDPGDYPKHIFDEKVNPKGTAPSGRMRRVGARDPALKRRANQIFAPSGRAVAACSRASCGDAHKTAG